MLKYMPVFFFSSFYIVYIIVNAVLKQYQIAGYRFFLLSLFFLSLPLGLDLVLLHGLGFCFKAFGMNERYKSRREAGPD